MWRDEHASSSCSSSDETNSTDTNVTRNVTSKRKRGENDEELSDLRDADRDFSLSNILNKSLSPRNKKSISQRRKDHLELLQKQYGSSIQGGVPNPNIYSRSKRVRKKKKQYSPS